MKPHLKSVGICLVLFADSQSRADAPKELLRLRDLFELEYASDPQISPDGKRVVYVRSFRAAVVCKPVINWYSFVLTADIYPFFTRNWFPGPPWDHAEHYMKRSPISLAGNVTTPTLILTGEVDHRTPMSESEQFYQAL